MFFQDITLILEEVEKFLTTVVGATEAPLAKTALKDVAATHGHHAANGGYIRTAES